MPKRKEGERGRGEKVVMRVVSTCRRKCGEEEKIKQRRRCGWVVVL